MCPEFLSNGLFHSARKNLFQFNNVVMFFTAVYFLALPILDLSGGHCKHPLGFCQVEGRRRGTAETFVAAGGRTAGQLLGVADQEPATWGCEVWSMEPRTMGETWILHGNMN